VIQKLFVLVPTPVPETTNAVNVWHITEKTVKFPDVSSQRRVKKPTTDQLKICTLISKRIIINKRTFYNSFT
jgi:hypothetical protein